MIKDNQRYFNRMHVVIDALVIIVSYFLAWAFRYVIFSAEAVQSVPMKWYMQLLIGIVPIYLILYYAFNLYTPKRVQGRRLELSNIVKANTVGMLLLICYIVVILREVNFARLMFLYFYLLKIDIALFVFVSLVR